MAFDDLLATRVRDEMIDQAFYSEKKMFGALCFMLRGNMVCGVLGDDLIVRVGQDAFEECMQMTGAKVFDAIGKKTKSWVIIDGNTIKSREALKDWIDRGVSFCSSLPPK